MKENEEEIIVLEGTRGSGMSLFAVYLALELAKLQGKEIHSIMALDPVDAEQSKRNC